MHRDPTEFRDRFARWKSGDEVYQNGLPKYYGGKSGKVNWKRWDDAELTSYPIPFVEDKEITLNNAGVATGARLSTNLLDSIADNAERAGLPLETAIGIAVKESTFGNPTDDKSGWNLSSGIRQQFNGVYPGTRQHINQGRTLNARDVINYHKGEQSDDPSSGNKSLLQEAFEFYKQHPDKYNPGQKNYQQMVDDRGKKAMQSPEMRRWKNARDTKKMIQNSVWNRTNPLLKESKFNPPKFAPGHDVSGFSGETKKRIDVLYKRLRQKGFDDISASGIIGNAIQESSLNPDSVNKYGYSGLWQNSKDIRRAIEEQYGDYSYDSQLRYLDDWVSGNTWIRKGKHAKHTSTYSGSFKRTGYANATEAADQFLKRYERAVVVKDNKIVRDKYGNPVYQDRDKRLDYANKVYSYLTGNPYTPIIKPATQTTAAEFHAANKPPQYAPPKLIQAEPDYSLTNPAPPMISSWNNPTSPSNVNIIPRITNMSQQDDSYLPNIMEVFKQYYGDDNKHFRTGKLPKYGDGTFGSAINPRRYERKIKNLSLIDTSKALISDEIMAFAQRNKGHVSDKSGHVRNVAQSTYLLNPKLQKKIFIDSGYIEGTPGDYGLVRKAVGDRDIPVYQKTKDAIRREDLTPIGNVSDQWWGTDDTSLVHAGHYPTAIYRGIDGKFYQKAWDLNDYGDSSAGEGGAKYANRQIFANILDKVGSPTVVTTGYQPIEKDWYGSIPVQDMMAKKGLYPYAVQRNGDVQYGLPEIIVTKNRNNGIQNVSIKKYENPDDSFFSQKLLRSFTPFK